MAWSFNTAELDSTEKLALAITREDYVAGDIDVEEFERRAHAIVGLAGDDERRRVLHTDDVVDITGFGHIRQLRLATAWRWPDESFGTGSAQ